MKTLITVLACLTLLAAQAVAQDHNYIPLEPGNELWYVNTGDPSLTAHTFFEAGPGGTSIFNAEFMANGSVVAGVRGHFTGTPEGDVIWIGPEMGGNLVPFTSQYLTIDAPLFAGKTWSFETSHPIFGAMQFTAEVVAEEFLNVPGIGTLYCYKVHYDEFWENLGPQVADRWYADGFGLVKFFSPNVSPDPYIVTAGVVIPVEEKTWGWVKALYK
jgi:hypothetical protein